MSLIDYHRTTSSELLALTNKIRSLITHWGEDGRYKEAVLKNVIGRFLPEKYLIGTGFVIKQTENRGKHLSSRQIDLIIYDDASPVLFKEGDFVILTPDAVRGIIEVKANLQNQGVTGVLHQANENGQFILSGKEDKTQNFFNGVFSYEGFGNNFAMQTFVDNYLQSNLDFSTDIDYLKFKVNHVSLNKDWFIKIWNDDTNPHSIYNIEDLSFSFFISNLIDTLANKSIQKNNFIWYATDKELNLKRQF
ncbi:DUF6602 domain-containing protein [Chryseobacterium indoltheticum]|uniref:DUF6602 domain-containing protein n=1 Tax=Chryseobacterium indoltheticum TaxID=254 RepID=A0A381FGH2_9FLAO|nr:DUF6602 domain-containing protein [Chryseobacterium indoltheticum]SUX45640.1 Uncharacterised protein [Chryseobacterium indoltheticum]